MRRFLHILIFGDWLLKLFSISLAILTWLAVSIPLRQKPVEVPGKPDLSERPFFDVPVVLVSSDSDVRAFKVRPSEVNVTVRGASNLLENLKRENIRVQVDLTSAESVPGLRRRLDVITPQGVAAMTIEPEQVEIIPPAPAPAPKTSPK